MSFFRVAIKVCLLAAMLFGGGAAMAGPARCSVNNEDSSCAGTLSAPWQTPPACPASAGWTTVVPAKWIGSQYNAPQCNFQAPPTCPPGFDQSAAPSWNGSGWVGLACTPSLPPVPIPNDICTALVPSQYAATAPWSGPMTDPNGLRVAGLAATANNIPAWTNVFTRAYDGPTYSLPCFDRNNYNASCYVNGSTVVGLLIQQASFASSGQCNH